MEAGYGLIARNSKALLFILKYQSNDGAWFKVIVLTAWAVMLTFICDKYAAGFFKASRMVY